MDTEVTNDDQLRIESQGGVKMRKKRITGTREWAEKTANCVRGCGHNCLYCYGKCMAIRFGRKTKDNWHIEDLVTHQIDEICRGKTARVMFPSTHDITPTTLEACTDAIKRMLAHGHFLLIVSKPHVECIKRLCAIFGGHRDRMLFRFTIGSADNQVLRFWEPNAPSFEERIECLRMARTAGFQTSVSCEPMLDDGAGKVIENVMPHVTDSVWIGKMNRVRQTLAVNGASADAIAKGESLMAVHNDVFIRSLYEDFKDMSAIKWKDSIKKIVGLDDPIAPGMDV